MSKLFLIVGNSGSGKDSLIGEVLKSFPITIPMIKTPRRVITRPSSPETENFKSVTEEEFRVMKNKGDFALDWFIYGLYYGVPKIIEQWMDLDHPVIINVSRSILSAAKDKFPDLKVIFIKVPFETTEKRIRDRGREEEKDVSKRLERAKKKQFFPDADCVIDNTGELKVAADKLLNYIVAEYSKK